MEHCDYKTQSLCLTLPISVSHTLLLTRFSHVRLYATPLIHTHTHSLSLYLASPSLWLCVQLRWTMDYGLASILNGLIDAI